MGVYGGAVVPVGVGVIVRVGVLVSVAVGITVRPGTGLPFIPLRVNGCLAPAGNS